MYIQILLTNDSKFTRTVTIFDAIAQNNEKKEFEQACAQLRISIAVSITDENGKFKGHRDYWELMRHCIHTPVKARVTDTTNNRKINFFIRNPFFGEPTPFVPQLDKNKKRRTSRSVWDSKQWNIADTGEFFILDALFLAHITLDILSSFELVLEIIPIKPIVLFPKKEIPANGLSAREIYVQRKADLRAISILERHIRTAQIRAKKWEKNEALKNYFKQQENQYKKALSELLKIKL